MKFTIKKMQNNISYYDYSIKKLISHNTYAFIDKDGHCIIIVGGEKRKDLMTEYLSGDSDELGIKYKIITLP